MPRPPTQLVPGWADKRYVMSIWNEVSPKKRARLLALMTMWEVGHTETRTSMAASLGISRRQLCRWVAAYNRGGIQELVYRQRRRSGRKKKISAQVFNEKILPLASRISGEKPHWTFAEIQRELATEHNLKMSYSTLRRRLRSSGISLPPRPSGVSAGPWPHPWPREYGTGLADYLAKTGQTLEGSSNQRPHEEWLLKHLEARPCSQANYDPGAGACRPAARQDD